MDHCNSLSFRTCCTSKKEKGLGEKAKGELAAHNLEGSSFTTQCAVGLFYHCNAFSFRCSLFINMADKITGLVFDFLLQIGLHVPFNTVCCSKQVFMILGVDFGS